jgi:hypothetical protein
MIAAIESRLRKLECRHGRPLSAEEIEARRQVVEATLIAQYGSPEALGAIRQRRAMTRRDGRIYSDT